MERPEQISEKDDLRRELEGKIDKKLDCKIFFWGIGVFILILCGIINHIYSQQFSDTKVQRNIERRLTILETKFELIPSEKKSTVSSIKK